MNRLTGQPNLLVLSGVPRHLDSNLFCNSSGVFQKNAKNAKKNKKSTFQMNKNLLYYGSWKNSGYGVAW
jgi:hypothetical protein